MFRWLDNWMNNFDSWLYGPYYKDQIRELTEPTHEVSEKTTLSIAVDMTSGDITLNYGGYAGCYRLAAKDRESFLNQINKAVQASRTARP